MVEEVIPVREHFYILSTSARIDDRTRVLKPESGNAPNVFYVGLDKDVL